MTGAAVIVQGDALHLPLPDESVDLIVTSPPYFALRAYQAGPGEIGSEPTPQAFLQALWAATAEMVRVLRPGGSIFVNLGDKYNSAASGQKGSTSVYAGGNPATNKWAHDPRIEQRGTTYGGIPAKSLMLLPERYRIGCVDQLGLIARAVIVWDKPNGLPESVTDRVRRSHEDWVHLTRFPRYYSATDEIREPTTPQNGLAGTFKRSKSSHDLVPGQSVRQQRDDRPDVSAYNPLGKLPGSVWTIPSEPLRLPDHLGVQHYAAFPSEWPRRLILGFSPPGICLDCGQGRVPVVEREGESTYAKNKQRHGKNTPVGSRYEGDWNTRTENGSVPHFETRPATILGYACGCTPHTDHPGSVREGPRNSGGGWAGATGDRDIPSGGYWNNPRTGPWREYHLDRWTPPPTRPAIILDPFAGTGTTPMVARALGRIGIGVDLSAPYCRAARWRVRHDGAKAISRTNLERQGSLL